MLKITNINGANYEPLMSLCSKTTDQSLYKSHTDVQQSFPDNQRYPQIHSDSLYSQNMKFCVNQNFLDAIKPKLNKVT